MVCYTHSAVFFDGSIGALAHFSNENSLPYEIGMGTIGISIFFIISGFLITRSYDQTASPYAYAVRRGTRIYPAFFVCVAVTILGLGSCLTELPLREYLLHPETWSYWYNLVLPTIDTPLPGLFTHNPVSSVNGAIWTLGGEVLMYILTPLCFPLYRRPYGLIILLSVCIAIFYMQLFRYWPQRFFLSYGFIPIMAMMHFIILFLIGGIFYTYRALIPANKWLCLICALVSIAGIFHAVLLPLSWLCFSYIVLYICFITTSKGAIRQDISYGLYLSHIPVMQLVRHYWPYGNEHYGFYGVICLTISILVAACSWWLIEKPSIAWSKRYLSARLSK